MIRSHRRTHGLCKLCIVFNDITETIQKNEKKKKTKIICNTMKEKGERRKNDTKTKICLRENNHNLT